MASSEQRKLAAIMFTDMVGYSALSQRDEALALELLEEHRQLVREIIPRHEGREVKTTGDGFLLEFPSAVSAVRAAIDIQLAFHVRNETEPTARQILLRIGIHVGDIVMRDGDIHGDGVNIAARIEPLASPGGICVSEDVEHQVRNKLAYSLLALGPTELKNIVLPIAVHRVMLPWQEFVATPIAARAAAPRTREGMKSIALLALCALAVALALALWRPWRAKSSAETPTAATGITTTPAPVTAPVAVRARDEKSVAVLAFANLSDDKANEYFSDGISEELLNVLAKIPGLKVSARTSSFFFKGRQVPMAEIARQLGVAYVVEGSVRKAGNEVRITAQLIKASDGFHVWSDTFTRELKNVFAVQDEIAGLIAKKLELKIDESGKAVPAAVNPEAYRLYLEGRREWNQRSAASLMRAQELFEQALAIDPNFARAQAGLADTIYIASGQNAGAEAEASAKRAEALAQGALKLDPKLTEAYATLGIIATRNLDSAKADAYFKQAIALNPNYSTAHHWYGLALLRSGDPAGSLEELQRAAELDPLAPVIQCNLAYTLSALGQSRRALAVTDAVLKARPDFQYAKEVRAMGLIELGRKKEATTELRQLLDLPAGQLPGGASQSAVRRLGWATDLAVAEGPGAIEKEIAHRRSIEPVRHDSIAQLLAELERYDEALAELGTLRAGEVDLTYFLARRWKPMRNDPRFRQIIERVSNHKAYENALAYIAAHPEPAN